MDYPGRESIRATYTIRPDAQPEDDRETQDNMKLRFPGPPISAGVRTYIIVSSAAIAALVIVLIFTIAELLHVNSVNNGQAAQIRGLNQANARMSSQLSQMTSTLSGISTRLAAADPTADPELLTCSDLRKMGLMATTGGTVASVPGIVNLSQSPVKLPGHCSARKG